MRLQGSMAGPEVRAFLVCLLLAASAGGCGPSQPRCFALEVDCSGVAPPSFDELHAELLAPSCGTGLSCHVEDDVPAGDLRLDDSVLAYETLLDPARALVVPERPECSEVVRRVTSGARFVRMPPARALTRAEMCAIVSWVSAGAPP